MRALHARFGEPRLDEAALHALHFSLEDGAAGRLAAVQQVLLGLVQEPALAKSIARAVARLLHHVEALGNFAIGLPVDLLELVRPRERELVADPALR